MNKIHLPVFDFNAGAKGRRQARSRSRSPPDAAPRTRGTRARRSRRACRSSHYPQTSLLAPRYHLYQNCAFQRLGTRGTTFINIPLLGRLHVSPFSKRKP